MAQVDPDDDTIDRHVIRLHSFDTAGRRRAARFVAAFDDEAEFMDAFTRLSEDLRRRRAAGEVEPGEHYAGTTVQAGDRRRQADGRLLWNMFERGIVPTPEFVAGLELPPGMQWFHVGDG